MCPNGTSHWQGASYSGTIAPDILCSFNNQTFYGSKPMMVGPLFDIRIIFNASSVINRRIAWYDIEPTQTVAFATDDDGFNGYVIATARTKLWVKGSPVVYNDGSGSAYLIIKYSPKLQKRTITEWHEVNTSKLPQLPMD
ncbi:hypothetical protein FA15DRAFT_701516 [Coprinopsis marcescibilis]|uniref:Uncharacterized protein n=1 Tax=Coprinopsis marcescibilis TaxID=230819 RepID=A0A5C3L5D0_COPMA|nr:hypothetical protein FA15DRAFT_701516 [Coprinopsis marcescibilis]